MNTLVIGIKGHVVCIDKSTGTKVWETKLKSTSSITNVCLDEDLVFAYAGGHLYCLELNTGNIKWENKLDGFGYGPCIIASQNQASAVSSSHTAQQQTAATAAVAAATAATVSSNGG